MWQGVRPRQAFHIVTTKMNIAFDLWSCITRNRWELQVSNTALLSDVHSHNTYKSMLQKIILDTWQHRRHWPWCSHFYITECSTGYIDPSAAAAIHLFSLQYIIMIFKRAVIDHMISYVPDADRFVPGVSFMSKSCKKRHRKKQVLRYLSTSYIHPM